MRSTRRLTAVGVLLGLLLSIWGPASPAHAEPTDADKTQAATTAAQGACSTIGANIFGSQATELCVQTLVTILTDPTTATAKTACTIELTALGLGAFQGAKDACVALVSPLIAGAAAAMAANLELLSDVVNCVQSSVQGDVFACNTKLVQHWIGEGVQLVWSGLSGVILAPTRAVNIIDLRANPDAAPEAASFRSLYSDIGWLAGSLIGVFVMLSLIQALLRRSSQIIKESLAGVAAWGVFWVAGMAIAVLVLQATDGMALFLGGEGGSKMQLAGIEKWLAAITKVNGPMMLTGVDLGSAVGVILTLVMLIAVLVIFVTLALREVSVVLIALMLPVLLAMQAGPGAMRRALPTTAKAFVTIAVSKPLMVVGLRLGSSFLSVPADGKLSLWGMLLGTVVLGISAFSPGVLYKLFGVVETAASGRSGGGAHAIDAAGRSAIDTADSARSVFSANAPSTPLAAKSTTAASTTGAATSGAGASAGVTASAGAGPLGLVIGAGMMAASTAVSAGGAIASQVGTGGGALGDAESMHPGQFPRSYGGGLPPRAAADLAPVPSYEPISTPPPPPPPPAPAP